MEQLPNLPETEEWKKLALEAFEDLETTSPVFARLTVNLMAFLPDSSRLPGPATLFQRELVVDLFDKPQAADSLLKKEADTRRGRRG